MLLSFTSSPFVLGRSASWQLSQPSSTGLLSPDCSSELRAIFASAGDVHSPLNRQQPPNLQRCQSVPPPQTAGLMRVEQLYSLTPQERQPFGRFPSQLASPANQLAVQWRARRNLNVLFEGGTNLASDILPCVQAQLIPIPGLSKMPCQVGGSAINSVADLLPLPTSGEKAMVPADANCSLASVLSLSELYGNVLPANRLPQTNRVSLDDIDTDDLLKALNATENVWSSECLSGASV